MTKKQTKYLKLKISTETGEFVKKTDEDGNPATEVTQQEIDQIYQSPEGFKHVGTILHTHSSPGCIYVVIGGWGFKICF